MKFLNLNRKQKNGFTLIEILLVVGFIAIAGIGVYSVYSKVQINSAANTEARNIDALRAGVKGLFAPAASTAGLQNSVVNNASITPQPMRTADVNVIQNGFGGLVTIATATQVSAGDSFTILYEDVPGAACTKLVTGTGSQFEGVTVGATVVKPYGANTQVDIVASTTACANAAGVVDIRFVSAK